MSIQNFYERLLNQGKVRHYEWTTPNLVVSHLKYPLKLVLLVFGINCVKNMLCITWRNDLWLNKNYLTSCNVKNVVKQILTDQFQQRRHESLSNSTKGKNYYSYEDSICLENYFHILPKHLSLNMVRFRTSNHKLPIGTGRWYYRFRWSLVPTVLLASNSITCLNVLILILNDGSISTNDFTKDRIRFYLNLYWLIKMKIVFQIWAYSWG